MKKYRRRLRLTEAEKAMMWNRWQQGDSLHAIARLLDTTHTSIRRHLVEYVPLVYSYRNFHLAAQKR